MVAENRAKAKDNPYTPVDSAICVAGSTVFQLYATSPHGYPMKPEDFPHS
jgi:hypothetical protein